jgi:hypothetical protein
MKRILAGFIDVWQVVVFDSFKRDGDPFINLFDCGVFLGVASMLGLFFVTIMALAKMFT